MKLADAYNILEDRSKAYYKILSFDGKKWVDSGVGQNILDAMNQLKSVAEMQAWLKTKFPSKQLKVVEDTSIGWEKQL